MDELYVGDFVFYFVDFYGGKIIFGGSECKGRRFEVFFDFLSGLFWGLF